MIVTEANFAWEDSEMSVLIAIALLLTGAGGYISSSMKEGKPSKRNAKPGVPYSTNSAQTPLLFGREEVFTIRYDSQGLQGEGPALLSGQRQYSLANRPALQGQPELLGQKDFESKRKTA
jgi:hypothetical protein